MNKSPIIFMSISGTLNLVFLIIILLMAQNIMVLNLPELHIEAKTEQPKISSNMVIDESETQQQNASADNSYLLQSMTR